jgi:quercetin dioxygenase-like cupin family protein
VPLHRDVEFCPLADAGDPDDWRPESVWGLIADERADVAVILEEIAVGDAIPLHRHQIDEVLLYDQGDAEVRIDGETYDVQAGDIVIVPAGAAHGTRNVGEDIVRLRAVFPSHRIDIAYIDGIRRQARRRCAAGPRGLQHTHGSGRGSLSEPATFSFV